MARLTALSVEIVEIRHTVKAITLRGARGRGPHRVSREDSVSHPSLFAVGLQRIVGQLLAS